LLVAPPAAPLPAGAVVPVAVVPVLLLATPEVLLLFFYLFCYMLIKLIEIFKKRSFYIIL